MENNCAYTLDPNNKIIIIIIIIIIIRDFRYNANTVTAYTVCTH